MIGERKDRQVNGLVDCPSCFERRQHPHAAPTFRGSLEQNATSPNHKRVGLDESPRARPRFFERKRFGIFSAAKLLHWANWAFRPARQTDERTKIDKRRVVVSGTELGQYLRGTVPKKFAAGGGIDWNSQIDQARQNASGVGFDNWNRLMEREGCDCMCGVFSDARQQTQFFNRARQAALVSLLHDFGSGVEISRAGVVAESFPCTKNIVFRDAGQDGKIRKLVEPFIIIRKHGGDLRLVEHQLGNENRVRIAGAAPREIAAIFAVPAEKRVAESAAVFWQDQDLWQTLNFQRPTLNFQFRRSLNLER